MKKKRDWYAHVTVATVIERKGKFLLVSEYDQQRLVYNQPAGHLEKGETILEAAVRETLEETGYRCKITKSLGVRHTVSAQDVTYIRHSFVAEILEKTDLSIDEDIDGVHWLSLEDCELQKLTFRSPMVEVDMRAYLNDQTYPLDLYCDHKSVHFNDGSG